MRKQISANGRTICVVLDPPTLKYLAPYALAMARRRGIASDFLTLTRTEAIGQYLSVEEPIRFMAGQGLLRVADPKEALCATGVCAVENSGRALYTDLDHVSIEGAELVRDVLDSCLSGAT
jgi:hypothetical protein